MDDLFEDLNDADFNIDFEKESFPVADDPDDVNFNNSQARIAKEKKKKGWAALGVERMLLKSLMAKGFKGPTPIQKKAIPGAIRGRDIVGMARTGSGKTAAFVVPLIQRLKAHTAKVGVRGLILSPTRELATQTFALVRQLGKFTDLRSSLMVGGESMENQFTDLARNPDILVATPGRLLHLMLEVGWSMSLIELVVFDEADRLFEMGFEEQLREIMAKMPPPGQRQTMLFSATMPSNLAEFAKAGLNDPLVFRLDTDVCLSPMLRTVFLTLRSHERVTTLLYLLTQVIPANQPTLVFAATHQHVEFLARLLTECHIKAVALYGKLDPGARSYNVEQFRSGRVNIMIVTDIAARGVDIPMLDNVINFHFPPTEKIFVHRVGRVARAGRSGMAISLATHEEIPYMIDLHLFLGRHLLNDPPATDVPVQETTSSSSSSSMAVDFGNGLYGRIPFSLLEEHAENLDRCIANSDELERLSKSTANSMKAYKETRTKASKDAVRRAKTLDLECLHYGFRQMGASDPNNNNNSGASGNRKHLSPVDAGRMDFLASIRSYRPSMTIMEVQARLKRSTVDRSIMREKRLAHDAILRRNLPASEQNKDADESHYTIARKAINKYLNAKDGDKPVSLDGDDEHDNRDHDGDDHDDHDDVQRDEKKTKKKETAPAASKIRKSAAERRRLKRQKNPNSDDTTTAAEESRSP